MARSVDPLLGARRRRQILEGAMACFKMHGFHQASMHQICASAGMSPGAVYRYFRCKDDIIAAIVEAWANSQMTALEEAPGAGALTTRLNRFVSRWLERFTEHGQSLAADILAEAAHSPSIARSLARADAHRLKLLATAIRAAQALGEVDTSINANDAAQVLFSAIDGMSLRLVTGLDTDARAARRQFRELAKRYLLAPAC